ncbi:MAG: hypothetical protein MRY63_07205 [Neomegalonema sp.]|nr:hypothetical protein [Neomegalonema sp.]
MSPAPNSQSPVAASNGVNEANAPFQRRFGPNNAMRWVHLGKLGEQSRADLLQLGLEEHAIDALTDLETRPRHADFLGGDLLLLRAINTGAGQDPDDMIAVRLWLSDTLLVSIAQRPVRSLDDARQRLDLQRAPDSPHTLALQIAHNVTERIREAVRGLETALEAIEDRILEGVEDTPTEALNGLRRQAISLRRFTEPQLEALEDLLEDEPAWLTKKNRNWLREIANNTERAVEALIATREHIAAVQNQIELRIAEQTRRTSHLLALVATVFLPLNLFAALLGANVGGIPLSTSSWGFVVIVVISLLSLMGALIVLVRSRWLG